MAENDNIWRQFVSNLNVPEEGEEPPAMETIVKKRVPGKKFMVQKIVTEIYVYTDVQNHQFAETTFQDMYILGEMTESKLNRLLSKRKREQG